MEYIAREYAEKHRCNTYLEELRTANLEICTLCNIHRAWHMRDPNYQPPIQQAQHHPVEPLSEPAQAKFAVADQTVFQHFSLQERQQIDLFFQILQKCQDTVFCDEATRPSIDVIAVKAGIALNGYRNTSQFKQALWILYLMKLKESIPTEKLKYPTVKDFIAAYHGRFGNQSESVIIDLWNTANWMHELFKMVRPFGNRGLAMSVIA